jgi:O-antigen/teichoic acid export membrane protein
LSTADPAEAATSASTPPASAPRSVRTAAIWSMSSQYLGFVIQFVTSVILSRFFLSPEEVGVYSIALGAALLLAILQDFGLNRFVIAQPAMTSRLIRACYSIAWLFALIVALILAMAAGSVAQFYNDARLAPLLHIIALSFVISPFAVLPSALLARDLDFRAIAIVNVGSAIATAVVTLVLAAYGFSASSLAWGLVAGAATRGILAQWQRPIPLRLTTRFDILKPVLAFGSNSMLLQITGSIGVRSTDLIIGRLLTMAAVGIYSRAASLTGQLHMLLLGAVSGVFYPALARIHHAGESIAEPYERVVANYGALVWPAMAMLWAVSLPLVLFLFGENWEDVAPILAILALTEILFVTLPLHMDLPILFGRIRTLLMLNVVETACSIGLLIIGAQWGIEGVAWSRVGYAICWVLCYAFLLKSLIQFRWRVMFSIYLRSAIVAVATVCPILLSYYCIAPARDVNLLALIGAGVVSGLVWLAALVITRHPARSDIFDMVNTGLSKLGISKLHLR